MRKFALQNQKDSIWYPIYEGKEPDWVAIRAKLKSRFEYRNGASVNSDCRT